MNQPHVIGVISDTHGLLRPEAVVALQGSELIIHAGDVGEPEVLDDLRKIAPVVAIRGNVDNGIWAQELPQTRTVEIGGVRIYVIHNINDLSVDVAAAGFAAVISGHSHRPSTIQKNGVLFLNPGSAGPRRFNLPVSLALLRMMGKKVEAQLPLLRSRLGVRKVVLRSGGGTSGAPDQ
jgi:hypothetical protein